MPLVKMSDQFQGLPMESLIGGPLKAAVDAQSMLAASTASFINTVGFDQTKDGVGGLRTINFAWSAPHEIEDPSNPGTKVGDHDGSKVVLRDHYLEAPFLAMVPIPNLQIDRVNITFDMEVKSSETHKDSNDREGTLEAEAGVSYGPFSASVKISGKTASHQENTRSSDNSARYHVEVLATNHGAPEGLMRILDIIAATIAPVSSDPANAPDAVVKKAA